MTTRTSVKKGRGTGELIQQDTLQIRLHAFLTPSELPRSISGTDKVSLGTSIGLVRQENQDRAAFALISYAGFPERDYAIAALCDGIGGLPNGAAAAALSLATFISWVVRASRRPILDRLGIAAAAANQSVFSSFSGRSGSTLAAVMISRRGEIACINVGDTRVYGENSSGDLRQLSRDDTIAGLLGDREGGGLRNQLVQYVGMGDGIEPNISFIDGRLYRSIFLTSDGIHGVPTEAFFQAAKVPGSHRDLVRRLLSLADAVGGKDNATAVAVPTDFDFDIAVSQAAPGISVDVFSPGNARLSVWFPPAVIDRSDDRGDPRFVARKVPTSVTQTLPIERTPSTKRSKKASKKRARQSEALLPLDDTEPPELDVSFPDKPSH